MAAAKALTPLAMAILELLFEKPMHPYEMTQLMRDRRVDLRVKLRPGSLYHTVERLEAQQLIEVTDTQRQGRRPERTVYSMTDEGALVFANQARDMLAFPAEEYPQFAVALSAANELELHDVVRQLKTRLMHMEARVASDDAIIGKLEERRLPTSYWIDAAYSCHQRRAELEWTQKLVEDLEAGRIDWPGHERPPLSIVDNDIKEPGNAETA